MLYNVFLFHKNIFPGHSESIYFDVGTSEQEIETILRDYGYNIVINLSRNDWYFHI